MGNIIMERRDFLKAAAGASLLPGVSSLLLAEQAPADLKITRVVGFTLRSKRPKFVGKNAYRDDHGDHAYDPMLRISTSSGIEGIGWCSAGKEQAAALLGKNPVDFFQKSERSINSPLGHATMPLWDLLGQIRSEPVWKLLGADGSAQVPVYDGSIYFVDLLSEFAGSWQDRFRREIDMGWDRGHRFFKVKIGRGHKWMSRKEGDDRDVEVVQLIARHGGKDIGLGVDANNGYDPAGAQKFLERVPDVNLSFVEEMFPEKIEECLRFKEDVLAKRRPRTLLADGESAGDLNDLAPFIAAGAIEVLQADMNHFGIERILAEAALGQPHGLQIAPHNWGSVLGYYAQLHVGRAVPNFYRAEQDPAESDVLVADGYKIEDGRASVPESPGFGLKLNPEKFRDVEIRFDLKA